MSALLRRSASLLCSLVLGLCAANAQAHKPSDSYLTLATAGQGLQGRWDIALRDLDDLMGLDVDGDRALTWGEVRQQLPAIDRYVLAGLSLNSEGRACATKITDHRIDTHTDGAYLVFDLEAPCGTAPRAVDIGYRLLFEVDPTHRGLLRLDLGGATHTAVLSPDAPRARFDTAPGTARALRGYFTDGVRHIWAGYDHILFLCSLLLPAVALRRGRRWEPAARLRPVLLDVTRTVTAFTIAHTLTLGLAAFQVVLLPSRLVESAIALSVVLAALNNVVCVVERRRWAVAFAFGLIHGFGFAGVLAGLDLQGTARAVALFGFNLGVEAGQLAIVFVLLPVLYLMRATVFYRRAILTAGSCAIAVLAAFWLVERSFDLRLESFLMLAEQTARGFATVVHVGA